MDFSTPTLRSLLLSRMPLTSNIKSFGQFSILLLAHWQRFMQLTPPPWNTVFTWLLGHHTLLISHSCSQCLADFSLTSFKYPLKYHLFSDVFPDGYLKEHDFSPPQTFFTQLSGWDTASPSEDLSWTSHKLLRLCPLPEDSCGVLLGGSIWLPIFWAEGLWCESNDRMTSQSKRRVENKIDITLYCKF